MVYDEFKFRMLSGLFDLAGQVVSSQITKPNWDEQEKAMTDYYSDAKKVAKVDGNEELVDTKKAIETIIPKLERKANEAARQASETKQETEEDHSDLTTEKVVGGTACLPCVPPNTMIYSNPDCKQIRDLFIGDSVLDRNGEWTKIKKIFNNYYSGGIYDIYIQYQNFPITVTPEHPLLIENETYIKPHQLEKSMYLLFPRVTKIEDISYVNLEDFILDETYVVENDHIQLTSYNGYKINNKKIHRTQRVGRKVKQKIPVTYDLMKLIGFYIAEGCVSKTKRGKRVRFSFGKHERKYVKYTYDVIKKIFNMQPKIVEKKTGINVEIYSKILSNFFSTFGINSQSKKIPKQYLYLPQEKQKGLLEGYYKGDGYIRKGKYNNISCTTVSSKLAHALKLLLLRHEIIPSFQERIQKNTQIDGRILKSNGKRYVLDCWGKSAVRLLNIVNKNKIKEEHGINHGAYLNKKYAFFPIKKIVKREYTGNVMNIICCQWGNYT